MKEIIYDSIKKISNKIGDKETLRFGEVPPEPEVDISIENLEKGILFSISTYWTNGEIKEKKEILVPSGLDISFRDMSYLIVGNI